MPHSRRTLACIHTKDFLNMNPFVQYKASMDHVTLQVLIKASKDRQWKQKGPKKVLSRPVSMAIIYCVKRGV